jgi:hypothetical protein
MNDKRDKEQTETNHHYREASVLVVFSGSLFFVAFLVLRSSFFVRRPADR